MVISVVKLTVLKIMKPGVSWRWLGKGYLKRKSESLSIIAQEQILDTGSIKRDIFHTSEKDLCRICGKKVESVTQSLSARSERVQVPARECNTKP